MHVRTDTNSVFGSRRLGITLLGVATAAWGASVGVVGLVGAGSASSAGPTLSMHPNMFDPGLTSARPGKPPFSISWESTNWSGYAETSGAPYTGIAGQWAVPSVSPSPFATYSAAWVGIDGFKNSSLIQVGTEQDFVSGQARYSAWWTTSAQNFIEQPIPEPVRAGDVMTAQISQSAPNSTQWNISLNDTTQGWGVDLGVSYSGPGASAEWIMEAPSLGSRVAQLAHYSTTVFDPGTIDSSQNPSLNLSEAGSMVTGNMRRLSLISVPSTPDSDTDGFAISYGSSAPPAPRS
jgi:hypothetical protein